MITIPVHGVLKYIKESEGMIFQQLTDSAGYKKAD